MILDMSCKAKQKAITAIATTAIAAIRHERHVA